MPRLVLFTGKGGVGKTTAAAATAALLASRGRKTLVVSTDAAHSLADAFGVPLTATATEVAPGLGALQVDAQERFEAHWSAIRDWVSALLGGAAAAGGVPALAAEELAAPPGAAELLALLEVRDQVEHGPWDAVLVDCAPTAETLRLLALPEILAFYLEKAWPRHRRIVRALGTPPSPVLDAAGRLHDELVAVRSLLAAASVRLVLTPEAVVVAEARRTLTALALHGYPVDSVIANRVFPPEAGDSEWGAAWLAAQASVLDSLAASLPGVPVRTGAYLPAEPVGVPALTSFGSALYGSADPLAATPSAAAPSVSRDGADYVLNVDLPFVERSAVRLARSGDELVVTVGAQRRRLSLPSGLRRCVAVGASAGDGVVRI